MNAKRILVADDDRLVRVTVSQGLRGAGYEVLEAADGEEAVAVGSADAPDLAVLDLRMPKLSGLEAARLLREEAGVPCVMLSAYDEREDVERAVREGALGYLVKPVDVARMLPIIETAIVRASEIARLRESEAHLSRALSQGRETSVAMGILMDRYHMTETEAFQALRAYARSHRRKLAEVARDLVRSADALNAMTRAINATRPRVSRPPAGRRERTPRED